MSSATRNILFLAFTAFSAMPAPAGTISVIFDDNRFGSIDDTTGSFTQISTLPLPAASGIASMNGQVYVEDMGSSLFSVHADSGESRLVGATGILTASAVFAGGPQGLFEIDFASDLYSIDPVTGAGKLVGATGIAANNGGFDTSLSADGDSLLYTAGRPGGSAELYRIAIDSGLATDMGSTGVTGIAGSAFVNGRLELYQYGQSANYIFSAPSGSTDFVRGAVLSAQIIDGGAVTSVQQETLIQTAPEPMSLITFCSGLLFIALAARACRYFDGARGSTLSPAVH